MRRRIMVCLPALAVAVSFMPATAFARDENNNSI